MPSLLRDQFKTFDEAWVVAAQPNGFHLTVSDAIRIGRRGPSA
jgi:hypothetical protein